MLMNILGLFSNIANQQIVFNIEWWHALAGLVVIAITIVVSYSKLQNDVKHIDKDLDIIKDDVKLYGNDIAGLKSSVESMTTSVNIIIQERYAIANSPRKLTDAGDNVLNLSGIKDAIDSNKAELLLLTQQRAPQTVYDAEEVAMDIIRTYFTDDDHQELNNVIKTKTFKMGQNIDIVYFVGGIYFRDIALPEMGFNVEDIENDKSKVGKS